MSRGVLHDDVSGFHLVSYTMGTERSVLGSKRPDPETDTRTQYPHMECLELHFPWDNFTSSCRTYSVITERFYVQGKFKKCNKLLGIVLIEFNV
jgi:hypothetical protein